MTPRNEQQKLTEGRRQATKPRFQIEKLEERIAPARGSGNGPCRGSCAHYAPGHNR